MAWPTTSNPRTNFVTLRLTDDEDADLNWLVAATGAKDRSDAQRAALARVVKAERARAKRTKQPGVPGPGMRDPEHTDDEQ